MTRADLSQSINITGLTGHSEILVGGALEDAASIIGPRHAVIITDTNLFRHYADRFPSEHVIVIETGESVKNMKTLEYVYHRLIECRADRKSMILAIGGGIVCDVAGFAASTFMRGVDFGFVATSLLAQVDASVGGKNGINFAGYKNMIGVFCQPSFVICDLDMLDTLPEIELRCGLAEVVKHALIADRELFEYIETNTSEALSCSREVIFRLVQDSVRLKAGIVNEDERETGRRAMLNFGHTIGHAIQAISDMEHGLAVSIGMVCASRLSVLGGSLDPEEFERIISVLTRLGLPVSGDFDRGLLRDAVLMDKKRNRDAIRFVLLDGIGRCRFEEVNINSLERLIHDMCQYSGE